MSPHMKKGTCRCDEESRDGRSPWAIGRAQHHHMGPHKRMAGVRSEGDVRIKVEVREEKGYHASGFDDGGGLRAGKSAQSLEAGRGPGRFSPEPQKECSPVDAFGLLASRAPR